MAHVGLDTPRSGLTFAVGSSVRVTWEDTILHDGIGYDLDLLGADEQILAPIVHELPTSVHSYDWQVPDIWCVGCYLMVTQVNLDHDYTDSVLVNIYGKMAPAASGGSAGTGGSPDTTPGGAPGHSAGSGGTSGHGASAGVGGTLTSSVSGGAGASGSPHSPATSAGAGASTRGGGKTASSSAAEGGAAGSTEDRSAAGDAATDQPEAAAGDPSLAPSHMGGCTLDFGASSPRAIGVSGALLSLLIAARRRRVARRDD